MESLRPENGFYWMSRERSKRVHSENALLGKFELPVTLRDQKIDFTKCLLKGLKDYIMKMLF